MLAAYPAARSIGGSRIIFNIQRNQYRLVVKFRFDLGKAYVRFVGTHADFDQIDATTILSKQEIYPMTKPIRPIRDDDQLERALERVSELLDSAPGSPEAEELEVLSLAMIRKLSAKFGVSADTLVSEYACAG